MTGNGTRREPMPDCTCGGPVSDGDPNGPVCTNTGLYVHACREGTTEIRAQITLIEPELEDICEEDLDYGQMEGREYH
jgi:hypothetical protein